MTLISRRMAAGLSFIFWTAPAWSAPPLNIDIGAVLPQAASAAIVKTFGLLNNHRPYRGAVPIGSTIDFGAEVTLVHLPNDFAASLVDVGLMSSGSSLGIGSLPAAKAHFAKGLGKSAEIGVSGLWFRGNSIWGADFKVALIQPEEGMTWSFRFSYAETNIDLSKFGISGIPIAIEGVEAGQGNLKLSTRTLTPAILGSVRLDFTEPYIGAGLEMNTGQIEVPITIAVQGYNQTLATPESQATQGVFFSGLSIRAPAVGFRFALEGGYGTAGMSYLGVLAGFSL